MADAWASDQESNVARDEAESAASASEFEPEDDFEQQSEDDDEVQPTKNTGRRPVKVHRTDVTAARSDVGALPKRKSVTSSITLENA